MTQRGNYKWAPAHDALLQVCFEAGKNGEDIAAEINARFGTNYTFAGALSHAAALGLRRTVRNRVRDWSEAQNEELRRRVANQERQRNIASAMGIPYSAVVCQIGRLKIITPSKAKTKAPASLVQTRSAASSATQLAARINRLMNVMPAEYLNPVPFPIRPEAVTDPLNLSLTEVDRYQCRWIMNEDMTAPLYCGHSAKPGKSWCAAHHEVTRLAPST